MSETSDGTEDLVLYEVEDGVAILTINRPDKLNALSTEVLEALADAVSEAYDDDDVKAVVLTGAGEKSFVAGADIAVLAEQGVLDGKDNSIFGQQVMDLIAHGPKAVVGAVNGFALGGGCELALACDFCYASDNAIFGQPEVGLGTIPGYGGTQRLPRLVGSAMALELILSGKKIDAQEALRIGLVNQVLPQAELLDACKKIARLIGKQGPVAVQMAKEALRRGAMMPLGDGLSLEADLFGLISATEDMGEGMMAFLEKRKPEFKGQ